MMRKLLHTALSIGCAVLLSSCYRIPVPQGNVISPSTAQRIKSGMSPNQVVAILGNPVLNNAYVADELAYVYTFKKGRSRLTKKRFIVYFKDDKVSHVESDYKHVGEALPNPN